MAWEFHLAWRYAIAIGYAPTVFMTINWTLAPSSTRPDPLLRIGKVRDCMKSYLARQGCRTVVWLEARENPGGQRDHVHLAMYVPPALVDAFTEALPRWVHLGADSFDSRAVQAGPITAWVGLQRYLLKGATLEARRTFMIPVSMSPFQGTVSGPRVRVSHSIGRKARKAAGFAVAAFQGVAAIA